MADSARFNAEGSEFCCAMAPGQDMIDYNGHLNVAYYGVLFEEAARSLFPRLDISKAYRERSHCAFFAAELHQVFHREVGAAEPVSLFCQILDFDGRKLHAMYFMVRQDGILAASQEILYLHVDHATRRVTALPEPQAGRLRELAARHAQLPTPADSRRSVGIRRQKPAGSEHSG
jgi:acyl-CoA thioester hydrolase